MDRWTAALILMLGPLAGCENNDERPGTATAASAAEWDACPSLIPSSQPLRLLQRPTDGLPPRMIGIADFNGDALPDLALVRSAASAWGPERATIAVFLATHPGGYPDAPSHETHIDPTATALAVADFNLDGRTDLVVASFGDYFIGRLDLLTGNGDGTFAAPSELLPGFAPVAVAAADFNGDAIPDLAASSSSQVAILIGVGDGSFSHSHDLPFGAYLAAGDLDGDGRDELAVIENMYDSRVNVYTSLASGPTLLASLPLPNGHVGNQILIRDIDRDGAADVVAASVDEWSWAAGAIRVYYGGGGVPVDVTTPFPAYYVAAGDANGDGFNDLVHYVEESEGQVGIAWGGPNRSFAAHPRTLSVAPALDLAAADLDGDGIAEIVVASDAFFAASGGSNLFAPATDLDLAAEHAAVADMNGDGRLDLVAVGNGEMRVLPGNGSGSFGPAIVTPMPIGTVQAIQAVEGRVVAQIDNRIYRYSTDWTLLGDGLSPAIGDLDGDGALEVIAAHPSTGAPVVFPLEVPGQGPITANAGQLALGDLDADGDLDVVILNPQTSSARSYRNDAGSLIAAGVTSVTPASYRLLCADLDGDGRVETMLSSRTDPAASWRLDGIDLAASPMALPFSVNQVTDLDGDGRVDLVGVLESAPGMALWALGRGEGGFCKRQAALAVAYSNGIAAGDLDGNGVQDLVAWASGAATGVIALSRK